MSDSEDFPKLNEDDTSSNESEHEAIDETDSENSDISNDENHISASALVSALRDAGQNVIRFDDLSELDRLDDKFLIENFNQVCYFDF